MPRTREQIRRGQITHFVAVCNERFCVAGEGVGIAGDVDDARGRELGDIIKQLGSAALTGRIEDHNVGADGRAALGLGRGDLLLQAMQIGLGFADLCTADDGLLQADADGVAFGGWPIDVHPKEGLYHKGLPTKYINFSGRYSIPYKCFYSKNVPNLMMAGRDISVSKLAMASTRVMGTCAIGGQAVGTAAAIAVKYGCNPKEVGEKHIRELQQTLLKEDCYIPGIKNEDQNDLARGSKISASSFTAGNNPEKVVSGVTRAIDDESNVWESESFNGKSQWIAFNLEKETQISQIRVVFDPDLNKEIMITQTKRRQDTLVKGMPHTLVKDYTVKAYLDEQVVFEKQIKDNIERLAVINIGNCVKANKVVVEVQSSYGIDKARIFEVRIY